MKTIALVALLLASGCVPIVAVVPLAVSGYQAFQAAEEAAEKIHKLKEKIKKDGGLRI